MTFANKESIGILAGKAIKTGDNAMLFDILPQNFFSPLAAPGKVVYWECICRLFAVTNRQLSFGVERDVLVVELQYYFDSSMAAGLPEEQQRQGELYPSEIGELWLDRNRHGPQLRSESELSGLCGAGHQNASGYFRGPANRISGIYLHDLQLGPCRE